MLAVPLLLLFGFLPFGWIFGLLRFEGGAALSLALLFSLIGKLFLFFVVVYGVLVLPVHMAYEQHLKDRPFALKLAALVLFLSPPLLSYGYYLGNYNDALHGLELGLSVVPAVMIAAIAYIRRPAGHVLALFLTLGISPAFFVVSDVLGPFLSTTTWYYASRSAGFYLWRALFPFVAVASALVLLHRRPVKPEQSLKDFSLTLGILSLSSILVKDFHWLIFYGAILFLLWYRKKYTYWVLMTLGVGGLVGILALMIRYFLALDISFVGLSMFLNRCFALLYFGWLIILLSKADTKKCWG